MKLDIDTNAKEVENFLAPLYCRYPGQSNPQSAYIEIDPAGRMARADWNGEIGGAVPMPVYHGRILRVGISPYIRGDVLADLLESKDFKALLVRICTGHTWEWSGNNMIGHLTDDARDALQTLTELCERELDIDEVAQVWDVGDWLPDAASADVTADMTEDDLVSLADRLTVEAENEGVLVEGDVLERLRQLRDGLNEEL